MSKRLSLLDLLEEERAEVAPAPAPPAPAPAAPAPAARRRAAAKADYLHISITVPPDLFERLQARSSVLRRQRQPYTLSHIARLALAEWLAREEREENPS
ncbi:MAG: hypothetical protein FJ138_18370 [Deltaproteobacteria bacterium]|nr:hypothetical protein [Deltaproteobacteria bacterium]